MQSHVGHYIITLHHWLFSRWTSLVGLRQSESSVQGHSNQNTPWLHRAQGFCAQKHCHVATVFRFLSASKRIMICYNIQRQLCDSLFWHGCTGEVSTNFWLYCVSCLTPIGENVSFMAQFLLVHECVKFSIK